MAKEIHHVVVERARQALESDNAPPRVLPKRHYVFDPRPGEPEELGFTPGYLDLHGNTLIPAAIVPVNHHTCVRTFKAGEVVSVDESEPHLARFLEGSRYFRRARHSDLKD
jgi:hypothetical protein